MGVVVAFGLQKGCDSILSAQEKFTITAKKMSENWLKNGNIWVFWCNWSDGRKNGGNEGSDEDKRLKQIYYNWKACWWDDKKP